MSPTEADANGVTSPSDASQPSPDSGAESQVEGQVKPAPSASQIRRWRRYLAEERLEADTYRELARRRGGVEHDILAEIAKAEQRHEQHWLDLLGEHAFPPPKPSLRVRMLNAFARTFGSVFLLAMMQRAEGRSEYDRDADATPHMAADEHIHGEVVRALAAKSRGRMSGTFRAAIFGANDGLVSNLALIVGMAGVGSGKGILIAAGVSGLLAGALSMGAGEYVSVKSQRELLEASNPDPEASKMVGRLDVQANELALVYRARGMDEADAEAQASRDLANRDAQLEALFAQRDFTEVGEGFKAAISSFLFFASGALIPLLPFFFPLGVWSAMITAVILVGVALLFTGGIVGVLSGASPLPRALRQLAIGYGAAAVTYALGLAFGTVTG